MSQQPTSQPQQASSQQSHNPSKIAIITASIGAAGVIIAAIIGGIFLLVGKGLMPSPTPTFVGTTTVSPTLSPLPTLVQHPSLQSQSTNKNAVPFSQPVKAGDLIVVAITQWVGGVSSVTDDQSDTYTPVVKEAPYATLSTSPDSVDGKDHDYAQLYYAKNVKGGTTTVTVKFMATENTNVGIYEFSGFGRTASLDQRVAKIGYSQYPNGGTLNTTTGNELCFVVGVDDDGNNSAPMQGSQYHSLVDHQDDSGGHERFYTEYLIAPQGRYQTDFSIATESHWAVVGAVFKP